MWREIFKFLGFVGEKPEEAPVEKTEKTEEPPLNRIRPFSAEGGGLYKLLFSTYICILQCKKCGKLNKTIEKV